MATARFIVGETREVTAKLPDASVDFVLTSPPFLALRSYLPPDHPHKEAEVGIESTPADFIDTLLDLTEEWARVLTPYGSICVELGDTYSGSSGEGGDLRPDSGKIVNRKKIESARANGVTGADRRKGEGWPTAKSLCFIPELFGASLAYGRNLLRPERTTDPWIIRNFVVWCRPNPAVGALSDKYRPATSYMTVATKAKDRWFDLDAVRRHGDPATGGQPRRASFTATGRGGADVGGKAIVGNPIGAPPLDWWVVSTEAYEGSHYATWPRRLITRPIMSMCPLRVCTVCDEPSRRINESEWSDCGHASWRRGMVLDPFAGSGTTIAVATGHGRDAIGIDFDERNADLAMQRIGPLFLTVEHA